MRGGSRKSAQKALAAKNMKVAGIAVGLAAGLLAVHSAIGYRLHCRVLEQRNVTERAMAKRAQWNLEAHPLVAFDPINVDNRQVYPPEGPGNRNFGYGDSA